MSSQKPNAAQIRSALALLKWENQDLAKACKITAQSVSNIKNGVTQPQLRVLETMFKVFDDNGIEFTDNSGVRFKSRDIVEFKGIDGFKRFMDDIYETAKNSTFAEQEAYPICCSNVDDKLYIKYLKDYFTFHIRRMTDLKLKVRVHILIKDKPYSYRPEELTWGYRQYRRYPEKIELVGDTVFYAYGRKLGILMLSGEGAPQAVVINSPLAAKAYREQFTLMWQMAAPLEKDELDTLAKRNKETQDPSPHPEGNKT